MTQVISGVAEQLWDFLVAESAALDERRHADWLDMLSDDFRYEMPVPRSTENPAQSPYDSLNFYAHESKSFLSMRFARIASDHAWSERPPAFVRHFVSNMRILDQVDGDRWTVATNVLVVRTRLPEPPTLSSAGRRDTIVRTAGGFRLRHRIVYLDTELPTDGQLGVIY